MPNNRNKVKFGLKNVHWALCELAADGSATFGATHPWPGAVSLAMDQQAERSVFRADNMDYYVGSSASSYEGDLTMALIPDDFKKQVLGYAADASGVLYEPANPPTVHFALLFQFEGDVKAQRRVLYNCTATAPGENGETTGDGAIEPQTEALNLLATAVYFPNVVYNGEQGVDLVKAATTEYTDATAYNGWFDEVPEPPTQLIANAYAVNQNLIHVLSTFAGNNVAAGGAFEATLSAAQGYTMGSVIVTMGDQDVTATAYTAGTGAISIAEVTGPIQITATASAS